MSKLRDLSEDLYMEYADIDYDISDGCPLVYKDLHDAMQHTNYFLRAVDHEFDHSRPVFFETMQNRFGDWDCKQLAAFAGFVKNAAESYGDKYDKACDMPLSKQEDCKFAIKNQLENFVRDVLWQTADAISQGNTNIKPFGFTFTNKA